MEEGGWRRVDGGGWVEEGGWRRVDGGGEWMEGTAATSLFPQHAPVWLPLRRGLTATSHLMVMLAIMVIMMIVDPLGSATDGRRATPPHRTHSPTPAPINPRPTSSTHPPKHPPTDGELRRHIAPAAPAELT